jgi:hypothetical protein
MACQSKAMYGKDRHGMHGMPRKDKVWHVKVRQFIERHGMSRQGKLTIVGHIIQVYHVYYVSYCFPTMECQGKEIHGMAWHVKARKVDYCWSYYSSFSCLLCVILLS